MDNKIIINNENMANYVMFKLDKLENEFSLEELDQITELVIDYNEEKDSSFVFLDELTKFTNIKSLTLRNGYIYDVDYNIFLKLRNLTDISFDNCEFENADLIATLNIESLSIINCKINNYSFIGILKNLKQLSIVNGTIEMEKINTLSNLNYLQLSYSKILDNPTLNINSIIELYIDNTSISDLNFLTNLTNLQRLSIDEKQYSNNKETLDKLLSRNILILNENMVEFGGESNAI